MLEMFEIIDSLRNVIVLRRTTLIVTSSFMRAAGVGMAATSLATIILNTFFAVMNVPLLIIAMMNAVAVFCFVVKTLLGIPLVNRILFDAGSIKLN